MGFSMFEYAMVGAEIAKYCGATALTFNMHNSSMAWSRFMYELPNLTEAGRAIFAPLRERQFRRAMVEKAIFSQPISEGGQNWTSKPNRTQCRRVDGGWTINGFKKFASLAGYCDYYTSSAPWFFLQTRDRATKIPCCSSSTRTRRVCRSKATGTRWACAAPIRAT